MEEFRTSIFEQTRDKTQKRLLRTIGYFSAIGLIWVLYFSGFPFIGIKLSITFSVFLLGIKLYDDKVMGISAYGERRDTLVISNEFLEISNVRIPYQDLTDLVIYVDEYLGMPKGFYGIHHGGNNKIEFNHNGRIVSFNYVIKNKHDYERVSRLVDAVEKNPELRKNLRKLD